MIDQNTNNKLIVRYELIIILFCFSFCNISVRSFSAESQKLIFPKFVLSEISGIILEDIASGTKFVQKYGPGSPYDNFLFAANGYLNSLGNECLILNKNPGGTPESYSDQMILFYTKNKKVLIDSPEQFSKNIRDMMGDFLNMDTTKCGNARKAILPIRNFKSNKGIKLGITKQQLISFLGKPNKFETNGKNEIIIYLADDMNKYDFLIKLNMPDYFGIYIFKNDKLVWLETGFPNP